MPTEEVLRKIKTNENFHGIAVTSDHSAVCNLSGVSEKTPFPIHSVGKILSGVLMVEMLEQGIIDDKNLTAEGIAIPPEIKKRLESQPQVLERLSQKTLLQAMNHEANLGDYIDRYVDHLRSGGEARGTMSDMVDFVGTNWEGRYSNDGLLFAGFALQNLYNSKTEQNLSYEKILHKLVVEPSKTNISMVRPDDVHYKDEDKDHLSKLPVTPAGGHFASADDLLKFGEYLYGRCQDKKFLENVKKYGKEFYDEERNVIYHGGYMEGATREAKGSATEFGVFLDDGKTIVVLMDRDASENDRDSKMVTQTYARGFYKELRNSLEQEKKLSQSTVIIDKEEIFVERPGLQKPDEKPQSLVEAAQTGKYGNIGSKGGAHEL
jgi:CubicO group peptidase (beta-lactamase class C family)